MSTPQASGKSAEPNWGIAHLPEKAMMLFKPAPYKVLHGGRGSAKTHSVCRAALILGSRRKLFVLCARELQKSIKDSVHKALEDLIAELGLGWFYRVGKAEIVGLNGTKFVFHGIRNNITSIKSIEAIDLCIVFEANGVSPSSWEILLPTVRRDPPHGPFGQGSEVIIEFNPELATDETYKRWVVDPPAGTVVAEMNYRDNPWFPEILRKQMEEMRRKDYDAYLTVWEGKTRKTLAGAIYAKEMARAVLENRISPHIHYVKGEPVDVSFDLGFADLMAMWFWQQVGTEHHAIDYHGDVGCSFADFVEIIQARGYIIRTIYLPHDADNDHANGGLSILKQARKAFPGDGRVKLVPRISNIALGINVVRNLWPRIFINEIKCADGLFALQHYQYGVDGDDPKKRTPKPLHNWASNPADGLRTYAEGLMEGKEAPKKQQAVPRRTLTGDSAQSWMH